MSLVIDASITLAWCFDDEATEAKDAIAERVQSHGAIVPQHWRLEVANGLLQGERRKRLTLAQSAASIELVSSLPVDVDRETGERAWRETLALARSEQLTAYDAAYLELALRRGLPLATLDKELAAAAKKAGVPLVL